VSGVVNARFNALVAVVHTAGLSLVLAAMAGGVFRLRPRVLLRTGVTALCVVALLFAGTRAWLAVMIPPAPTGLAALDGVTLRDGQPAAVVVPQEPAAEALPPAGRLARLQARGSLRIGVFADGVPFTFTNVAGALVGFDVEMGQALARALGVRAEFVVVDRDRLPEMLDRGVCDIVMSGLVVTVASSTAIAFSTPYHEGPLAFLVPDHRRAQFTSLTGLQASALPLGTPSERLAPPVRRLLPRAIVKEAPLPSLLASGRLDGVEAMVLPLAQAVYASRMQPALAAVVPDDSTYRTVAAYGLPMGADSLREAVNAWIEVARGAGQFASADDYWIRGRAQAVRAPRWSLGHSVFGWW
jgi:cyclohexadienyl dehydratase